MRCSYRVAIYSHEAAIAPFSKQLFVEPDFVVNRMCRMFKICFFPSPVISNTFIVHEDQVNLTRVWWPLRAVGMIRFFRNSAVTSPANAATIFILVPPQSLKNGRRLCQNHRHDEGTLFGVCHASLSNSLHPFKGYLNHARQRAIRRFDGLKCGEVTARLFLPIHNLAQ